MLMLMRRETNGLDGLRQVFICLRPLSSKVFVWGGLAILLVLNLVRIQMLNYCRIWSKTGHTSQYPQTLPATHWAYILYFDTSKEGG
jgi:hypothetical protein